MILNKSEELLWLKTRINILQYILVIIDNIELDLNNFHNITINDFKKEIENDLLSSSSLIILLEDDDIYQIIEYDEIIIPLKSMKSVCLSTLKLFFDIKVYLKNLDTKSSRILDSNIKILEKLMFACENSLNNLENEKKIIKKLTKEF